MGVLRPTTTPHAPQGMPNAFFAARGMHLATVVLHAGVHCPRPLKAATRFFIPDRSTPGGKDIKFGRRVQAANAIGVREAVVKAADEETTLAGTHGLG